MSKTKNKYQPTTNKSRHIKILAYGDSPATPSGFGTVMKNIFKVLNDTGRYQIDILGINDRGNWKDPIEHPYRIHQAMPPGENDPYGRGRLIDIIRGGGIDLTPPWDIIFFLQDPFILEEPVSFFKLGVLPAIKDIQKTHYTKLPPHMWFKTIGYFPIDSPVKPQWVKNAISLVDQPVAYTKYGQTQITLADNQLDHPTKVITSIIPHGTDTKTFKILDQQIVDRFRQDFFQNTVHPDTFLIMAVGRNSHRKDLARTFKIFREFQKRRPDSFLYIHSQDQGSWGSLEETAQQLGLRHRLDWNYPLDFIEHKGFPSDILNGLYNAANVLLSTSQGEGWGLPLTEAMATKTLCLAPNHTAMAELMDTTSLTNLDQIDELVKLPLRGIPLKAGSTNSEWINHGAADLERFRPLTNVDDAVKKLLWVYDHPQECQPIIERAYKWATELNWDKVGNDWENLIQSLYKDLYQERKNPEQTIKHWQSPSN